jgi:hypothetical protein
MWKFGEIESMKEGWGEGNRFNVFHSSCARAPAYANPTCSCVASMCLACVGLLDMISPKGFLKWYLLLRFWIRQSSVILKVHNISETGHIFALR